MALWSRARSLYRNLFRRSGRENELAEELNTYVALLADEKQHAGLSPEAAQRAARIECGGPEQLKEQVRDAWLGAFLETLRRDAQYGVRQLRRNPGFTAVSVLVLALGIGANTALFTIVNGVLLKPLPYPDPQQLVALHASKPNFPTGSISYPNFRDWQRRNRSFSSIALYRGTGFHLSMGGNPERIRGEWITSDLFPLLGVKPLLGRNLGPGEDEVGAPPVALISEALWKRKFAAAPDVIGSAITLDARRYTIIGVIPSSFDLLQVSLAAPEVYVPLGQLRTGALQVRGAGLGLHGFGRIRPGMTLAQARDDMDRVTRGLGAEFPDVNRGTGATIVPLDEALVGDVRPILLMLLVAVAFVLLIACVNVASLLLARSASRSREFAVRAALGASRWRIVRQLLTETVLLAFVGGALGLALALWGTRGALAILPQALPRIQEVHLDGRVLGFTVLISLLSGLLFGLAPALRLARPQPALQTARGGAGRRLRTHRALVVVEVATALVLLIGTGLMLRSMARIWRVDPGFEARNLLLFTIELPPAMRDQQNPAAMRSIWRDIHSAINTTPGVVAGSLRDGATPLAGDDELLFWHQGQPQPSSNSEKNWSLRYDVTPEYLRTMGIPLLRGRFFTPEENEKTPLTIVVDDVFAGTFFPGQDPIGKRVLWGRWSGPGIAEAEIVGVVGHVKQWGLEEDDRESLRAQAYTNLRQNQDDDLALTLGVSLRTSGDPLAAFEVVRRQVRQLNPELLVFNPVTMEDRIAQTLRERRFTMVLLAAFAAAALLLAAVGIFGVISYLVRERTQEIGVRMALGAQRSTVLRMVLGEGARLGAAGLAIGLVGAIPGARAIRSLLYGIGAGDPVTFAAVCLLLLTVALLASFVPAHRATRIDPMEALRYE